MSWDKIPEAEKWGSAPWISADRRDSYQAAAMRIYKRPVFQTRSTRPHLGKIMSPIIITENTEDMRRPHISVFVMLKSDWVPRGLIRVKYYRVKWAAAVDLLLAGDGFIPFQTARRPEHCWQSAINVRLSLKIQRFLATNTLNNISYNKLQYHITSNIFLDLFSSEDTVEYF